MLAAAEANFNQIQEKISRIARLIDDQGAQTVFVENLKIATVEIEIVVIGVFSLFEERMQHHCPQGSFFKILRERLIVAGQNDLADRIHRYYLAVNVLKHGHGRSYEELLTNSNILFSVKGLGDEFFEEGVVNEPESLVDVSAPGFFSGVIEALRQAHLFLESA